MRTSESIIIPERVGEATEINYAGPGAPDFGPLSRDRVPVRAMREEDFSAIIAIDRQTAGRDRSGYLWCKLMESVRESDVRVSLVVERDERPVGFLMARVDLGSFGRVEPTATIDTIGVDVGYRQQGIGRALLSQLLVNLGTLRVERIRTEVDWNDHNLLRFLGRCGFHSSQQLCFDCAVDQAPGRSASGA